MIPAEAVESALFSRYAHIKVVDGALTQWLVAERVYGGWQSGVINYPDTLVETVTPLAVFTKEQLAERDAEALEAAAPHMLAAAWWEPHASPSCDVFRAPHADCDCGADTP